MKVSLVYITSSPYAHWSWEYLPTFNSWFQYLDLRKPCQVQRIPQVEGLHHLKPSNLEAGLDPQFATWVSSIWSTVIGKGIHSCSLKRCDLSGSLDSKICSGLTNAGRVMLKACMNFLCEKFAATLPMGMQWKPWRGVIFPVRVSRGDQCWAECSVGTSNPLQQRVRRWHEVGEEEELCWCACLHHWRVYGHWFGSCQGVSETAGQCGNCR